MCIDIYYIDYTIYLNTIKIWISMKEQNKKTANHLYLNISSGYISSVHSYGLNHNIPFLTPTATDSRPIRTDKTEDNNGQGLSNSLNLPIIK